LRQNLACGETHVDDCPGEKATELHQRLRGESNQTSDRRRKARCKVFWQELGEHCKTRGKEANLVGRLTGRYRSAGDRSWALRERGTIKSHLNGTVISQVRGLQAVRAVKKKRGKLDDPASNPRALGMGEKRLIAITGRPWEAAKKSAYYVRKSEPISTMPGGQQVGSTFRYGKRNIFNSILKSGISIRSACRVPEEEKTLMAQKAR